METYEIHELRGDDFPTLGGIGDIHLRHQDGPGALLNSMTTYERLMVVLWGVDYIPLSNDDFTSLIVLAFVFLCMLCSLFYVIQYCATKYTKVGQKRTRIQQEITKRKMSLLKELQTKKCD